MLFALIFRFFKEEFTESIFNKDISYKIPCLVCFKVYEKEPEMDLGEEQKKVRIGLVTSPFGGFSVHLLYRTKMEIDR